MSWLLVNDKEGKNFMIPLNSIHVVDMVERRINLKQNGVIPFKSVVCVDCFKINDEHAIAYRKSL